MLSQETQAEVTPKYPNNAQDPLNDHDYCSPNKNLVLQHQLSDKSTDDSQLNIRQPSTSLSDLPNQKPVVCSNSSMSDSERDLQTNDNPDLSKSYANENLSDSSSSASLSSSVASSKELVIAQDSRRLGAKLPAPKDTPSVSKSKLAHKTARLEMDDEANQHVGRVRAKRVRQNTSVTDKSEWIMGDDQIDSVLSEHLDGEPKEKRHKAPKEHDSAFNQYTSSDYSSSDAESDQESDYNSEDDPNRLWCVCQKPHGGKFMISCDICQDWFHGHCVGVTKMMGDRFEKQGKEWFCGECQEKLRAGVPRNAIPKKIVKKEKKKKKLPAPGKRGRGRPRKSEVMSREGATRVSQRTTRKSSSSLDPKLGVDNGRLRRNLAKSDARSESYDEFEDSQRLKELIKERKKEFFYKRALAEQQKAAKRSELGLGRQALTANLSDSLDSLATSTSTPNMNNLPINIKSEHKERPKPNIVLQINTKKDTGTDQTNSSSRIVTTIVRSPKKSKQAESTNPIVNDLFTAEPIQINKKMKLQVNTSPSTPAIGDQTILNGDANVRKRSSSGSPSSKNDKSSSVTDNGDHTTSKKKRKDSESSTSNGALAHGGSEHIAQKIKESLETRIKQIQDLEVAPRKIEKLSTEIEGQLNECFKSGTQKYLNKFRSLIFNLRDPKNQGLVRNVLTGEILPARLVRMSPDEMASHELAKWRERENKHSIELIKRDAQLAAQQVIVKKTHKGEEVISAPSINEPDDPSAEADKQEPHTISGKHAPKESRIDGTKTPVSPSQATSTPKFGPLKMKITGIVSDSSLKTANPVQSHPSAAPFDEPSPFVDTTKDHSNHIFDISCKICTKQQTSEEASSSLNSSKHGLSKGNQTITKSSCETEQPEQPKRFRVSIETKLDPANLSRLKEPLIRPVIQPSTSLEDDLGLAKTPPCEKPNNDEDEGDNEEEQYESGFPPSLKPSATVEPRSRNPDEPCWSGTITMPDIAKFSALARPASGFVDFMKEELSQSLVVCGRIAPDQVQGYIKKLKSTSKNQILLIQLFPLTKDDKSNFDSFFDYLYSRNRYGVIQTSPQILKDFYILPIHEKSSIPEVLKPIKGPGIDRKESSCLLGLLVRSKRSASTTSNYTPTPIK